MTTKNNTSSLTRHSLTRRSLLTAAGVVLVAPIAPAARTADRAGTPQAVKYRLFHIDWSEFHGDLLVLTGEDLADCHRHFRSRIRQATGWTDEQIGQRLSRYDWEAFPWPAHALDLPEAIQWFENVPPYQDFPTRGTALEAVARHNQGLLDLDDEEKLRDWAIAAELSNPHIDPESSYDVVGFDGAGNGTAGESFQWDCRLVRPTPQEIRRYCRAAKAA